MNAASLEAVSRDAIRFLWVAWLAYWVVAAFNVKSTAWREPFHLRWRHSIPFLLAAFLLFPEGGEPGFLGRRFLARSPVLAPLGAVIVAVGLGLAVWARLHLGREWSGTITLKKDHALVDTGPYRLVRHPIYTGLLLAFVGTTVSRPEWRCLLATALMTVALVVRCGAEEAKMRETFPEYAAYERRTRRLIPFLY